MLSQRVERTPPLSASVADGGDDTPPPLTWVPEPCRTRRAGVLGPHSRLLDGLEKATASTPWNLVRGPDRRWPRLAREAMEEKLATRFEQG